MKKVLSLVAAMVLAVLVAGVGESQSPPHIPPAPFVNIAALHFTKDGTTSTYYPSEIRDFTMPKAARNSDSWHATGTWGGTLNSGSGWTSEVKVVLEWMPFGNTVYDPTLLMDTSIVLSTWQTDPFTLGSPDMSPLMLRAILYQKKVVSGVTTWHGLANSGWSICYYE